MYSGASRYPMNNGTSLLCLALAGLFLAACGKAGETKEVVAAGGTPNSDGGRVSPEPLPTFSDAQWVVLRSLSPATLPPVPADVSNSFAEDEVAARLGQTLFFDNGFSGKLLDADNDGGPNTLGSRGDSGKVSCAGCHVAASGFSDTRSTFQQISLGTGWTRRRTPSLLDVGQAKIVMWGGRYSTLWSQPFGPLENPLEMNSSRLFVAERVASLYGQAYEKIFGAGSLGDLATSSRFPTLTSDTTGCKLTTDIARPRAMAPDAIYECHGVPGDHAEYDGLATADQTLVNRIAVNFGKALAAYERKLTCGQSRFDAWVNGSTESLSASEQRGAMLFIEKGECASCHSGPYFSDQKFHNVGFNVEPTKEGIFNGNDVGASVDLAQAIADPIGIVGPYSDGDDGRLPKSVDRSFEGAFRTPTLRCVSARPSFMHSGTVSGLESVVGFFSTGGNSSGNNGTNEIKALELIPSEIVDLTAFLKALDGSGPAPDLLGPPS